jgi:hypothetical protein
MEGGGGCRELDDRRRIGVICRVANIGTLLSWIPIVAPVLAVLVMILWDVRGTSSAGGGHWDRLIELSLLGLLVVTGIFQLSINESQVKLSEVVERPWVSIEGTQVVSQLTFKDGKATLDTKFFLKNTGHVPAAHVLIGGKFFFRPGYPSKELDGVWERCEQFRATPLANRGSGISIFPDQQQPMVYSVNMAASDVKQLGTHPATGAPTFAGCIDYGWGDGLVRHQTRFVYEIDKKGPDGNATIWSSTGGDIQSSDVMINVNPILAGNPD